MNKPSTEQLAALARLLAQTRAGGAEWFRDLLAANGYQNPASLRGKDLAALAGVTPAAVTQWHTRDGCPRNPDGTYNLVDVWAWRLSNHAKPTPHTDAATPPPDPLRRKQWAEAELKLDELRVARRELIPRAEFREMLSARIVAVAAALDAAPEALAPRLANKSALEIRDTIRTYCNNIRDTFSDGLADGS